MQQHNATEHPLKSYMKRLRIVHTEPGEYVKKATELAELAGKSLTQLYNVANPNQNQKVRRAEAIKMELFTMGQIRAEDVADSDMAEILELAKKLFESGLRD